MSFRKQLDASWKSAVLGGCLCVGLGVALLYLNLGRGLKDLSYDLIFYLKPVGAVPQEVLMVYMDDTSFKDLGQTTTKTWDLNLHTELVNRFTADGARVVVFDVVFNSTPPAADLAKFVEALRRNRKVVLAAGLDRPKRAGFHETTRLLPWEEVRDLAAIGTAELWKDKDAVNRSYYPGDEVEPSLPLAAARVAGLKVVRPSSPGDELYLKYYGPALTLPKLSYSWVTNQPAGAFSNKCIFIGALPKTLLAREEHDLFRTPHAILFGGSLFPGAEIWATAFLNLIRNESLGLWPESRQAALIIVIGLLCGCGLSLCRPWSAGALAVVGIAGLFLIAYQMVRTSNVWFAWAIPAFAQIPTALAWSIRGHFVRLKFEKEVLQRTVDETTRFIAATKATAAQKPAFVIPDHSLVRLVGRGAYGEVWLARNVIGAFHVAKLVKRRGFPNDEPYEREFRGIQKFMPLSRSHPGFVHILHVGRNDEEKFFYCVMEAGDDRKTGQQIDPDSYQPKTLSTELDETGLIEPEEGLRVGLALTDALAHLHRHQLIHRDIKPPNIIYVNGAPKFADIGLVTTMENKRQDVSQVGTEGYMAPEGPGTQGADVYALGKVLYEAVMGKDRRLFPEVPTAVFEEPPDSLLRRLQEIIFRACEPDPQRRYQTAAEMHRDLASLQKLKPH